MLAFAGNIWEVSAVRAWFVAYLTWIMSLPHNRLELPSAAIISGLASLAGFPVSILVAECALRWGRRAVVAACVASVLLLLALAGTAGGASLTILPLLCLAQMASLSDASALASGAVATADPARRGTSLAVFAFVGYGAAFVGPVAVGFALDAFGGAASVPEAACDNATRSLDPGTIGESGRGRLSSGINPIFLPTNSVGNLIVDLVRVAYF